MDPRRANYDPHYYANIGKRGASRSPEGAGPHKLPKTNPGEGSSTPNNTGSSRHSSISNAVARPGGAGLPVADSRRPSNHSQTELRKENGVTAVNSPDSLSSKYEDAPSGRTTPLSVNGVMPRQAVPPVPQVEQTVKNTTITTPNPVIDLLMGFSNQVTSIAASQIKKEQMEAQLNQANDEFNSMSGHFGSFPAIKESKTMKKKIAERNLRFVEDKLNAQMNVQKRIVEGVAAIFNQPAEVKPTSRVESDVQLELLKLRTDISDVDKRAKGKFRDIEARVSELSTKFSSLDKLITDVQKQFADFQKDASPKLGQMHGLRSDINQLKKVTVPASGTSKTAESLVKLQADGLRKDLSELGSTVMGWKKEFDVLSSFVMGEDDEILDTPVDDSSSIAKKVKALQELGVKLDLAVGHMKNAVHEEGKDPVVKRLKNIDRLVNNLTSQVQSHDKPPLQQRLSQLEQDCTTLEADLKAVKYSAPPGADAPTAAGMDDEPLSTRLGKVETDVKSFENQLKESNDAILEHIGEGVSELEGKINSVDNTRSGDANRINNAFADITTEINGVKNRLSTLETSVPNVAITIEAVHNVNAAISELQERLGQKVDREFMTGALGAFEQQLKALAASRTPTPGPANSATARLPNGAAAPLLTNGMPPPTTGSPQMNGVPQNMMPLIGKFRQEVQALTERHDAQVHVTQRLQMQYNNLTTEEVCQAMLDQLATIWPHAKEFEISIRGVKSELASLQQNMQKSVDKASGTANTAVKSAEEAKKTAETASKSAAAADNVALTVRGDVQKMRQKVDNAESLAQAATNTASASQIDIRDIKTTVSAIEEKARQDASAVHETAAGAMTGITTEEIQAFKDQVAGIEKTAEEAHRLSAEHATKLGKTAGAEVTRKEMGDLRKDVEALSEQYAVHDSTLQIGDKEVVKFSKEMSTLKERLARTEKKLELLEKEYLH